MTEDTRGAAVKATQAIHEILRVGRPPGVDRCLTRAELRALLKAARVAPKDAPALLSLLMAARR